MSEKNEWKLVPVEPTSEMWAAVNKLDDEMAAGGYDGKGASIEQAWACLVDAAPAQHYQWLITVAQMKVLAAELIRAAETMGGDDDESAEIELILSVAKPGTVQDDDCKSNTSPILTVHLAEYAEEGVYPIDPLDPTGGRVDAPAAGDAREIDLDRVLSIADEHAEESREDGRRVLDRGGLLALAKDVLRAASQQQEG